MSPIFVLTNALLGQQNQALPGQEKQAALHGTRADAVCCACRTVQNRGV